MKAILDKEEVKSLKADRERGMTFKELSKKYNISKATAYKISVVYPGYKNEYTRKSEKSISDINVIKNSICVGDKMRVVEEKIPKNIIVSGKNNNYFYGVSENGYMESFTWGSVFCGEVTIQKYN